MKSKLSQRGFIGSIILIILALAALKFFFDFNIIEFLKSPNVSEVLNYIKKFFEILWTKYIAGTFWYIWNNIVVDIIWETFVNVFNILKGWVDSQS